MNVWFNLKQKDTFGWQEQAFNFLFIWCTIMLTVGKCYQHSHNMMMKKKKGKFIVRKMRSWKIICPGVFFSSYRMKWRLRKIGLLPNDQNLFIRWNSQGVEYSSNRVICWLPDCQARTRWTVFYRWHSLEEERMWNRSNRYLEKAFASG